MLGGGPLLRVCCLALLLSGAGCVRLRTHPVASDGGAAQDAGGDGVVPPDALVDQASPDFAAPPWPTYRILSLDLLWSSARSFSWGWRCEGQVPAFDRYAFCVATRASGLEDGTATCLGVDDDFGLGIAACVAADLWHPVTVHDLSPATAYFVRLSVFDKSGLAYHSPIMTTRTLAEPPGRTWFFDDELLSGVWLLELSRTQDAPHSGQWSLLADLQDGAFYNLHYGGMTLAYPGLDDKRFAAAYLELFLDAPKSVPLCLSLVGGGAAASFCLPRGYVVIDSKAGYQRVQVPLRRFRWEDGSALTAATLPMATKLQLGAEWGAGPVRLDEMSVRY